MAQTPAFTRIIRDLPATVPFVPPEALERGNGRPLRVRVGANESPFGISPRAREAMCAAVDRIGWYNDPEAHELREAVARAHGVCMDEVSIGGGIDDLLGLVVRLFVEPGDPVVSSLGAYPTFNYHVEGYGGDLHRVPYRHDHEDLDALWSRAAAVGARLLYVSNPDNPMGTWHAAHDVNRLLDQLPGGCVLILDEAYVDFAPEEVCPPFSPDDARVIRMRTFSKAHGMAGARVGYAVAHRETVAALNKVRNHFGVNRVAQAGALASLQDPAFVQDVVRAVAEGRRDYEALGRELGLATIPSATNFVAMEIGEGGRARALLEALLTRDVFVRMPGVSPLDRCIRVTVGTPEERSGFAEALRQVLPRVLQAAE